MPINDEYFMRKALAEARKAERRGEVPVGAVVARDGGVLSRGHNRPIGRNDPTAHAEVVAIRKACARRKNYRLPDCDLFVTIEPCAMCLGAAVQARIKRLVYGAPDGKAGAVRSILKFPFEKINHKVEVKAGVLEAECGGLVSEFFLKKRKSRRGGT
jgi:tRNA(adenine34) deaminase